jgi:hypothetical protein
MRKRDTPAGILGVQFANAVVSGDFQAAHSMLSSALRATLSPEEIKREFDEMTNCPEPWTADKISLFDGKLEDDEDDEMFTNWAYVSISGEGGQYNEAVTVTVERENQRTVIASVEWGRP